MRSANIEQISPVVERVVQGMDYELVDVEWKQEPAVGWVLRVFIDGAGGIGVDDCARVSHQLSATLDVEDLIQQHYSLEVSSPGLNRPLKKESDFLRFVGQKAKIRTKRPIGESRRNFSGTLIAVENGNVKIDVGDQVCEVPVSEVEKANLVYEFNSSQGR
ncbi:MAG: ribosome maturation factor RimP [Usitatibacter sp.]